MPIAQLLEDPYTAASLGANWARKDLEAGLADAVRPPKKKRGAVDPGKFLSSRRYRILVELSTNFSNNTKSLCSKLKGLKQIAKPLLFRIRTGTPRTREFVQVMREILGPCLRLRRGSAKEVLDLIELSSREKQELAQSKDIYRFENRTKEYNTLMKYFPEKYRKLAGLIEKAEKLIEATGSEEISLLDKELYYRNYSELIRETIPRNRPRTERPFMSDIKDGFVSLHDILKQAKDDRLSQVDEVSKASYKLTIRTLSDLLLQGKVSEELLFACLDKLAEDSKGFAKVKKDLCLDIFSSSYAVKKMLDKHRPENFGDLAKAKDTDLIWIIQNKKKLQSQAEKVLLERHKDVIKRAVRKSEFITGERQAEAISIGSLLLLKLARTKGPELFWKPNTESIFPAYLHVALRNAFYGHFRHGRKFKLDFLNEDSIGQFFQLSQSERLSEARPLSLNNTFHNSDKEFSSLINADAAAKRRLTKAEDVELVELASQIIGGAGDLTTKLRQVLQNSMDVTLEDMEIFDAISTPGGQPHKRFSRARISKLITKLGRLI